MFGCIASRELGLGMLIGWKNQGVRIFGGFLFLFFLVFLLFLFELVGVCHLILAILGSVLGFFTLCEALFLLFFGFFLVLIPDSAILGLLVALGLFLLGCFLGNLVLVLYGGEFGEAIHQLIRLGFRSPRL